MSPLSPTRPTNEGALFVTNSKQFPRDAETGTVPPGTVVAAPIAPAKGTITYAPGTPVVTVVQKLWDSPTIKAARAVVLACIAANVVLLGGQLMLVWSHGQSVFAKGAIDWSAQLRAVEVTTGPIIVAALLAWAKRRDNNPVQ